MPYHVTECTFQVCSGSSNSTTKISEFESGMCSFTKWTEIRIQHFYITWYDLALAWRHRNAWRQSLPAILVWPENWCGSLLCSAKSNASFLSSLGARPKNLFCICRTCCTSSSSNVASRTGLRPPRLHGVWVLLLTCSSNTGINLRGTIFGIHGWLQFARNLKR